MQQRIRLFTLIIIALSVFVLLQGSTTYAQENNDAPIILTDANPVVDVLISLPQDASGVVGLELSDAAVTLYRGDEIVFQSRDERIRALEFRIAPNRPRHRLVIERRAGVEIALARIYTNLDLTPLENELSPVQDDQLLMDQARTVSLGPAQTSSSLRVSANAGDDPISVVANLPEAAVALSLIDSSGQPIVSLNSGSLDGISITLPAGEYNLDVTNTNPTIEIVPTVAVSQTPSTIQLLESPNDDMSDDSSASVSPQATSEPSDDSVSLQATSEPSDDSGRDGDDDADNCFATITVDLANLRSGPSDSYRVIGTLPRNASARAIGQSVDGNWLLIRANNGIGWVFRQLTTLNGAADCSDLDVYRADFDDDDDDDRVRIEKADDDDDNDDDRSGSNSGSSRDDDDDNDDDRSGSNSGSSRDDDDDHDDDHNDDHDDDD